jgi:lipopolysaccharide heptosyltransferase II
VLFEKRKTETPSNRIDWTSVKRVLVVKLRSIGDTVLATPSLFALRRFLPNAQIDILLEEWVAQLLEGSDLVDNVLTIGDSTSSRLSTARELRRQGYDVVFNLHGGTTATFLVRATGAPHRVGFSHYQYSFLYNHLLSSAADFWNKEHVHSAEQQLALIGSTKVMVDDRPKGGLKVTDKGQTARVSEWHKRGNYTLLHPATAFFTKQWPAEKYAEVAEYLFEKGLFAIAVGSSGESAVLDEVVRTAKVPVTTFDDLTLPEITALASRARLFVGNDSGIAHIAAAVNTPSVVVFGSSNREHWRPWTDAPNEIVYEEFHCQPCAGYECKEFGDAPCIRSVASERVFAAIDRVLAAEDGRKLN